MVTVGSGPHATPGAGFDPRSYLNSSASGLLLRQIAAFPRPVVPGIVGLVALILRAIVQWIILFTALYPRTLFDFVAGYVRW